MLLYILTLLLGVPPRSATLSRDTIASSACTSSAPAGRTGHALTYDPVRKMVVLFGGISADSTDRMPSSLWGWNGTRWSCLSSDGPPGRSDASLAFDRRRQRLVMYGGRTRSPSGMRVLTDTWEWDGDAWTLADSVGPGARVHQVMEYDDAARAVTLIGGVADTGAFHDRWCWDGHSWSRVDDPGLPSGIPDALVRISAGRLVLVTADPDSTDRSGGSFTAGVWSVRDGRWMKLGRSGPRFSPMAPASATDRGLLLLLGWEENHVVTTPQWSAGRWTIERDDMPPPRKGTALTLDPVRGRVVLFGGDDDRAILGDIWEWDGHHWLHVVPRR
jgi:hypothetical protein